MAEFHDAQLISMWPFPFPYAQLSLLLTVLHMMISPLIMVPALGMVYGLQPTSDGLQRSSDGVGVPERFATEVQYTRWVWSACFLTCVSVVSVVALNIISLELENPFGEDHNDLPANEVHDHFRDSLLVLSDPDNWQVPRLLQNATLDFGHLKKRRDSQRNTIADFLKD